MSKFGLLRNEILDIYKNNKDVASDDKLLIATVWKRHGWNANLDLYENLRNMPSPETIRRTRQKLVAEGLMQPSEKAKEIRYKEFKNYREEFYYL